MTVDPVREQLSGYIADYEHTIAALRRSWLRQGLTQREIADRMGLRAHVPVSYWLAGRKEPLASSLFALADALGYDLALIPREEP